MIISFSYQDLDRGWTLEEVRFDRVNLLVGPSGAGKTRILEALANVRNGALRGARGIPSARWKLVIEGVDRETGDESIEFTWEAETQVTRAEVLPSGKAHSMDGAWHAERTDARFKHETIQRGGETLVRRNGDEFQFDRGKLPKLKESESAIGLLGSEETVWPLREALRQWRTLEDSTTIGSFATVSDAEDSLRNFGGRLDLLKRDDLLPTFVKLYVLQRAHRELFDEIVAGFIDVFPTVRELRVATYAELDFRPHLGEHYMANYLTVGMREDGVTGWVLQPWFSSGMEKTLKLLIETALAPKATVLLIDELENSLGINCLPEITDGLLAKSSVIQFIATSHHPQVINEIPYERWKLVTRRGSVVKVLDASTIPALQTASSLEKFTQLINLREYEEGVA